MSVAPVLKKTRVDNVTGVVREVENREADPLSQTALDAIDIMNDQVMENFFVKWGGCFAEEMKNDWNDITPTKYDIVDNSDSYEAAFRSSLIAATRFALKCILFDVKFKPNSRAAREDDPAYSIQRVGARRHETAKIYDNIMYCLWYVLRHSDEKVTDDKGVKHDVVSWLQLYLRYNPRFQPDVIDKIMEEWKTAWVQHRQHEDDSDE